jgi:tRNA (mo5U34)-methyltransferase
LWLQRCGFREIRCVDATRTTHGEQHSTEWMRFESLADFLDPDNEEQTIEGHPAPLRAIFTATRP